MIEREKTVDTNDKLRLNGKVNGGDIMNDDKTKNKVHGGGASEYGSPLSEDEIARIIADQQKKQRERTGGAIGDVDVAKESAGGTGKLSTTTSEQAAVIRQTTETAAAKIDKAVRSGDKKGLVADLQSEDQLSADNPFGDFEDQGDEPQLP